jgi:ABC-2 type transport system permease protein
MNPFITLLKRELWENQSIFLYVPVCISFFMIILMLLSLFVMNVEIGGKVHISTHQGDDNHEIFIDSDEDSDAGMPIRELYIAQIRELASEEPEARSLRINKVLMMLNGPLRGVLFFVIFFYLIGCLYEERKNRSILFWKSMPVSDLATVGSKLMSALIVAPVIYFGCILLTDICALIMGSILAILAEVPVWDVIWRPLSLFAHWFTLVLFFFLYSCWILPLIGWVMFVSSFAKSIPLVWTIGIPVGIGIAEAILFSSAVFKDFVVRHVSLNLGVLSNNGMLDAQSIIDLTINLDMVLGLAIGVVFMLAAVWKRGGSDET